MTTSTFFTSMMVPEPTLWKNRATLFNTWYHCQHTEDGPLFRSYREYGLDAHANAHLPWYNSEYYDISSDFGAMRTRAQVHHKNYLIRFDIAKAKFRGNLACHAVYRTPNPKFKEYGLQIAHKLHRKSEDEIADLLLKTFRNPRSEIEAKILVKVAERHDIPLVKRHPNGLPHTWKILDTSADKLHDLHDPHISEEDPKMVAYTQNVDKLRRGIQTRCKPGRYLAKFYPDLDSDSVKKLAESFLANSQVGELKFIENDDPDGWERIYADGPKSCMQGESCVTAYARPGNHLRLAYLEADDKITARAIVRSDKMTYVRVYPSPNSDEESWLHTKMTEMLESAGYSHGSLNGICLNTWEMDDGWVAPYIDCGNGGTQSADLHRSSPQLEGQTQHYFVITSSGDFELDTTSGVVDDSECCDECGGRTHEDRMSYIEREDRHVCDHCLQNNYTYAYGRRHQNWYPSEEVIYCESDGEYYYVETLNYHDIGQCYLSGNYYSQDELVLCSYGSADGEYVHVDDVKELPNGEFCLYRDYDGVMEEHFTEPEDEDEDEAEATEEPLAA